MYAVEFFLDEITESYVRDIWGGLKTNSITSYMAEIEELRPHVTVAVYNSKLPIEEFISRFDVVTKKMSQMDVKFEIVSTFPTSGTVFLAPTMTSHLFETHREYYNDLAEYNTFDNYSGWNFPDGWDPHCTLATKLNKSELINTLDYCLNRFNPMKGKIIEIGVVKLEFVDGKCVSSKTIFSNLLS
jgi:2'-5' RNA ligase